MKKTKKLKWKKSKNFGFWFWKSNFWFWKSNIICDGIITAMSTYDIAWTKFHNIEIMKFLQVLEGFRQCQACRRTKLSNVLVMKFYSWCWEWKWWKDDLSTYYLWSYESMKGWIHYCIVRCFWFWKSNIWC